jgi:hypothetical protein
MKSRGYDYIITLTKFASSQIIAEDIAEDCNEFFMSCKDIGLKRLNANYPT